MTTTRRGFIMVLAASLVLKPKIRIDRTCHWRFNDELIVEEWGGEPFTFNESFNVYFGEISR